MQKPPMFKRQRLQFSGYSWKDFAKSRRHQVPLFNGSISNAPSQLIFLLSLLFTTFSTQAQGPGGVSPTNLRVWLKADSGPVASGTAVTLWTDAAALNNYTQTNATRQPILTPASELFNYNPAVDFRTGRFMSHGPTGPFTADNKSGSVFTVVNLPSTTGTQDFFGFGGSTTTTAITNANFPVIGSSAGNVYWYDGDWPISSLNITAGQTSLTDFVWQYNVNNSGVLGLNGRTATTTGNPNTINTAQGSILGSQPENTNGYILEVIAYETNLSVSDQQKVRSYLGVKYGQTLSHNYLASDGTTIYNVSSYSANVTGIGRDDTQSLNQKQSRSVNDDAFVTIGNGAALAATNAANTNTFSADKSYEIIGDNGLAAIYTTAYTPGSFSSLASYFSMSRIWKVQETGTVSTVTISVPGSAGMYMLVKNTPSFSSGATEIAMVSDGNGNMTAQVDLTDGQYFTFAQATYAPGNVGANLQSWLKADAGTSTTTNATKVSSWANSVATNPFSMTQANATYQPTYTTNAMNFNPGLNFSNNILSLAGGGSLLFPTDTDPATVITVSTNQSTGGYNQIWSVGTAYDLPSMHWFGQKPDVYADFTTALNYPHPDDVPLNTPTIIAGVFSNNNTANNIGVSYNGTANQVNFSPADGTFPAGNYLGNSLFSIGSETQGVEPMTGYVSEAISYNRRLSDTELRQVYSYLAIKYGITLNHDYLSGTRTTIYNVSSYSANVTGIGRSDAQQLNQKQSKSVNTNGFVTIGNGSGIAATNVANTNTFSADNSYELIGDNGLSTGYATAYLPQVYVPSVPSAFRLMSRIWRVQETGTVGVVTISVPASSSAEALFVSNSAIFTPGSTTELTLTPDGNGNLTAQVDLANGQYFTFGAVVIAPGGVAASLDMWLKADAITGVNDGTTLTSWTGSAPGSYSVSSTGYTPPVYYRTTAANLANFNPAVSFNGAMNMRNTARLYDNTAPFSLIGVGVDRKVTAGELRGIMGIGDGNYPALDFQTDGVSPNGWNPYMAGSSPAEWSGGNALIADILGASTTQANIAALTSANSATALGAGTLNNIISYVNGYKETTTLDAYQLTPSGNGVFVGSSGGENYNGLIPEVIAYGQQLSDADMQKVQTYLAIKYGTTLGQSLSYTAGTNGTGYDYIATNGTTIWNTATNNGYNSNIFGVGRDDAEALSQKQSKSQQPGAIVTIGNGAALAATNPANTNTFAANYSYELIGDNNLSTQYTTLYTPTSFTTGANVYAMSRIWKVQESGTVGTVTISIPGSAGTYLLVNSTPSFASGVTEYAMTPDGNGNVTAQVDLANGQYFTFAKPIYAPGCVAANLLTWYKADVGVTGTTAVTRWADQKNTYDVTQTTAAYQPSLQPASAAFNFNPSLRFDGANDYLTYQLSRFISTTASGTMFGAASNVVDNGGYENLAVLGIDNPHMGIQNNQQIMWLNGSSPVQINQTGNLTANQPQVYGYYFNSGSNNGGTGGGRGLRLDGVDTYSATTASSLVGSGGVADGMWTIGSYQAVENWNGDIAEVILYDRSLTTQEKDRVDTYLSVKYGTTLKHNYLSGAGTTIYDVSSFSANVTGIGREDCQGLLQKQARSINSGTRLTIGVSNTIVSTNASHPGSFNNNATFDVFGDNGLTGLSSTTTGSCPPPPSTDKYTNLAYKVTETGSVPSTQLQFDVNGLGFNTIYPVWMQVASDAGFTSLITSVPMNVSGTTATTTYDFPANQTVYIRFAGNTTVLANICAAPKLQTFHWNGWNYGQKTKTITSNYGINNTLSNPVMVATVTDGTSDPNVLLYKPTVNWWPVFDGRHLFIPRNDNNTASQENSIVTTKMQFFAQSSLGVASSSAVAAQSVDFTLRDIDGFVGGKDVVKVYGKLGGLTILPKISRNRNFPFWDNTALTIDNSTGTITAGSGAWDVTVLGDAYVRFDSPVEEVYVEYTKQNVYNFKVYNDLRIGEINVTCKQPTPRAPLADNVYIYKQVAANPQKTNEVSTYKFTIQNTNCADKVINFSDVLPAGLTWVDSTATSDLNWGSINNYGNGQTLSITSMTVTPGTSYLYASIVGPNAGTFNNQATYQVTNGTNTSLLSDDPGQEGTTSQPTPLTLIANDPEANLVVTKSVDKSTVAQNGIVTYTFKVYNPNATAMNLDFQDALPGELTYVGGTLTGVTSGTTTPYSGSATMSIRDLSVPGSSTLTFGIQANVNSYTVGQVATNKATVSPALEAGYRIRTYTSNTVSTTIIDAGSFVFNCGTASVAGSFTANGTTGQTGTLTVPITGATAGVVSLTVSGGGFASSPSPFSATLTAGQTSISVPVTYDGSGSVGIHSLSITSAQATGSCSTTVTVGGIPDLAPIVYTQPGTAYNTTPMTLVVDVFELNSIPTSGTITVYVSKDPLLNLSFNSGSTLVGGRLVDNSIWTFDNTNPNYYIFSTTQVIPAGDKRAFGMIGPLTPGNTQGNLTVTATIVSGSGGDNRLDNNSDADRIEFFKK